VVARSKFDVTTQMDFYSSVLFFFIFFFMLSISKLFLFPFSSTTGNQGEDFRELAM